MSKLAVLSLGGSLLVPDGGINISYIKKFRTLIHREMKKGTRFIIVTGGGTVARTYQDALRAMGIRETGELDWVGIRVSRLNASMMASVFGVPAPATVITRPLDAQRRMLANHKLLFAGGEKPGQSTDFVAVQFAVHFRATEIYNLSNIRYVYDKDPKKVKSAKPYSELSWKQMKKIVGTTWTPGANTPFDPKATRLAARHGLTVKFIQGDDLTNVARALSHKPFRGTTVR